MRISGKNGRCIQSFGALRAEHGRTLLERAVCVSQRSPIQESAMNLVQSPIDHGSRDRHIRTQTYSPVRKLDGLPLELFASYWRDVHAPLCARLPGLGFYVQHHFSRELSANLWAFAEGVKPIDVVLDGAVEIGFASSEDLAQFVAASPLLFGDEVNLFGWDAAFFLPKGSKTWIDQQADGVPNGPDRLHRLHVYMHASLDADFTAWANRFAAGLASDPAVRKLRLHLPEAYDNANPQPPSPVDHFVIDTMRELAIMEIGFDDALSARMFFESEAYRATLAGQARHVRAMKVVLVTGVYTFVRDGKPTVAGLRGSRAAELIVRTGATNHHAPEVKRLFVRG
jgi:hypothetical protein